MEHRKLREKLKDKSGFIVYVELTGGPGFNLGPIEKFLNAYKAANSLAGPDSLDFVRKSIIPDGFDFAGVTLPQNPAGLANIKPADVLSQLTSKNLTGNLEFIPHITCKDHNVSGILSLLAGYRNIGIETILVMTGDKPMETKSVFELDSIGLLQLIRDMNNESYIKASPDSLDKSHQFFPGAAVSPFKYTEASQMQQYYKMEKKIACGARFFITQVGWDWRKSLELFRYLDENNPDVPIIGNVYLLSSVTPAPRLMHDVKLPGCFVSDQLLAKVYSESVDDHIERAAQQVAMYNTLGAAGVDIAGVHDFEMFIRILKRAADIGTDWERFKDNLHWPPKNGFYLYDRAGKKMQLSKSRKRLKQRLFNLSHRAILNPDYKGFYVFKNVMAALGTDKGKGAIYKLFNAFEKSFKYLAFDCEECGDCFLPENFGLCTIGGCEKAMSNAPCGDATVDGRCGNNLELVCIGELIYNAAAAEKGGIERLRAIINKPRNHSLEHSSSILNYLFGKDHTMKNQLITIGESIHASIPKTGEIMKQLSELGPNAYVEPSGPLNYIKALIESQVSEGADYIAVNLDALCEDNPQLAIDMMVEYVELVRKWGNGVPICIDSGNDDVLIAGLKECYNTRNENPKSETCPERSRRIRNPKFLKKPLINSVKVYTMEKILPLKRDFDFAFIGLLESNEAPTGPGGSCSVDQMYSLAKQIFKKAVGEYGFKNAEIFFDSTVFPLAIDMPMEPGVPGYTYRTFETIKKIKSDPKMKGVHCSLGISNCTRDLPGRKVGLCRAYLAKAIEYGLDAAIVNVAHRYGQVPPDAELLQLIDAYAKMDGSAERLNKAVELMSKFCRESRKPS